MLRACSSPSQKRCIIRQACRSRKRWRFFSLYGCGKNTTSSSIAWTGYVWLATITQAMGGQPVCFCSDPIPPVAVTTDQPAKHVLSRSAGEMALVRQPSFVHNGQLPIDLTPVVDWHCPLFLWLQMLKDKELSAVQYRLEKRCAADLTCDRWNSGFQ